MKEINKIKANIWKYFIAIALTGIWLTMPISILYFQAFNLTFIQIGLLFALETIIVIILNIPGGTFSDYIGKKWAFFIGCIFWSFGLFIIGISNTFHFFLLGFIFNGLSEVMFSGAYSSLIYDTLENLKEEDNYLKINSRIIFINSIMLIFGNIGGVLLFQINIRLPFLIFSSIILIASFFILIMKEPFKINRKFSWKAHINHIKNSLKVTLNNRNLKFLIIFSIILSIPMLIFLELIEQVYLINLGIAVSSFGIIFAFTRGLIGIFANINPKIEEKLGEKKSLYLLTFLYGIGFIILGLFNSVIMLFFLIILLFFRTYKISLFNKYFNENAESHNRGAILSINNFYLNLIYSIALVMIGIFLSLFTINILLIIFGTIIITISVPLLRLYYSDY